MRSDSNVYLDNDSFYDGNIYIVAQYDKYQKEHSEEYSIKLDGSCTYTIEFHGEGNILDATGIDEVLQDYDIYLGSNSTETVTLTGTYLGDIFPLSDFTDGSLDSSGIGSGVKTVSFSDFNDDTICNGSSINGLAKYLSNPSVSSFANVTKSFFKIATGYFTGANILGTGLTADKSVLNVLYESDYYEVKNVQYDFVMTLVHNDSNKSKARSYTLASDGTSNDNGIDLYDNLTTDNYSIDDVATNGFSSGYYDSQYSDSSDISVSTVSGNSSSSNSNNFSPSVTGGGSSGGSSTSYGDNSVTVNTGGVDQSVSLTTENSATKYFPTLVNKLLPDKNGDGGLSENVEGLVNSNGWLDAMKETYSFVPSYVFDALGTFFVACITILACGFLLRILLDLL